MSPGRSSQREWRGEEEAEEGWEGKRVCVLGGGRRCSSFSWEEKREFLALRAHCFNQTGAAWSVSGQLGLEQCERAPGSGGGGEAAE